MSFLFQPAMSLVARLRDRVAGILKVHPGEYRMVGEAGAPALMFGGLWVENTTRRDAFVSDFQVELYEPVDAKTAKTEWRVHNRPVSLSPGMNVPAFQRTEAIDLIVHLDCRFPSGCGTFRGSISAIGPQGFRPRLTALDGEYEIAGS